MLRILGGGLTFSSPLEKQTNPAIARAFSIVVWLIGLIMLSFFAFNVEWAKIDWFAMETWLKMGLAFLGIAFLVVFLVTPYLLFWAVGRIIAHRNKQRYGWPVAVFSIFAGIIAMALWLWLILDSLRYSIR